MNSFTMRQSGMLLGAGYMLNYPNKQTNQQNGLKYFKVDKHTNYSILILLSLVFMQTFVVSIVTGKHLFSTHPTLSTVVQ